MKDLLERFVDEHRNEFEVYTPDPGIWKGIKKKSPTGPMLNRKWKRTLLRIAAVTMIFAASYAFHDFIHYRQMKKMVSDEIYLQLPELKEAEIFYTNLVNERLIELKPYLRSYPDLKETVHADLGELDLACQSLKHDLKDNIANEAVIEALIQNYRLRLDILEDLLSELKTAKHDEDETESRQSI
jgi:hypothetical protein